MRIIELTKGYRSIVDDCDYDLLSQYKWNSLILKNNIYAMSQNNRVSIHRLLMNPPTGMEVDHINNDSLDNRRANLRLCTRSQNCANQRPRKGFTSKYKGVWWNVKSQKWLTQITVNYQKTHIGYFDNEDDAALAYNLYAVSLFGEFALLNSVNTFKGRIMKQKHSTHIRIEIATKALLDKLRRAGETYDQLLQRVGREQIKRDAEQCNR